MSDASRRAAVRTSVMRTSAVTTSARVEAGARQYAALLERAAMDPAVVGAVLTGSRGRDALVHAGSDWDVRLLARDDDAAAVAAHYQTPHGAPVEVAVLGLSSFDRGIEPDGALAWDRYSYVHVAVPLDKLDGGITARCARLARYAPAVAHRLAADALDGYINAYYRSRKNDRLGLDAASLLDAAESIGPFLTALFAIHGRVRPFNKYLAWELEHHPLPEEAWRADVVLDRVREIVATGDVARQASLFVAIEPLARGHDLGSVVDSWEPDVAWLRESAAGRR